MYLIFLKFCLKNTFLTFIKFSFFIKTSLNFFENYLFYLGKIN